MFGKDSSQSGLADVIELQPHELLVGLHEVVRETNRQLTSKELSVKAAQLYSQAIHAATLQALSLLSGYYADAKNMTSSQLLQEVHDSERLGRHMRLAGKKRPANAAAHAIVSGKMEYARAARQVLARYRIRIDDPDNGIFLPKGSQYVPHPRMPTAPPHSKIHTKKYFVNVTRMLLSVATEQQCRQMLQYIAKKLQEGTLEY